MDNEGGGCLSSFIDHGTVESHRLFLARRTVLQMLCDRGYVVAPPDLELTLSAFRSLYGEYPDLERLRISTTLVSDPSKKILVIFCGTEPVKLATVQAIFNQFGKEKLYRMIIVFQNKVTSKARDCTENFPLYKVETFQITELLINISKHSLMPKHEILKDEEKQNLLQKYNVQDHQLPRMLEKDAVARYFGLEKGTVVKVTYDREITGSHETYRCIV
ncbi:DNA-directed RNA polymerase V subunit 5A [Dendrobium catenatum]|uniref:DNA-directed RNA polymerase V subunit 5A n=1 Tax=Dendrobium catenatum TaxID=906689 RepID=A0A2I0X3Z3_9ASPA|nr:DNA-directed RNA polymerase V subunit 5A [Dendrobium catenatum]PKU82638.1 hypothetical protein MA16_Dca018796 [Dendrobium catenatum]